MGINVKRMFPHWSWSIVATQHACVLQCPSQHALGSKGLSLPVIVRPAIILHVISLVSVCLALVFGMFLWPGRWRGCDNTEVFLYDVSSLLCDCGWQNALQWTGWKESLRWGQNTLSLLLAVCPIIKHLIYWQASTITEGLSPPLSALWCSSFLRLNLLDEGKKRKKGEGEGRGFWFLTLCHLI